ncbi:JM149 [macacine gammaherpesvirus 11]|uniref:JM149 n=2 Tax=macacine gammaherpesvirus 11 TaxID=2560570 RepID=G9JMF6_9GAMA|nr:JM149 [Macaca fuscata rhadinovirus]AAT00126.1 JM149 [Macaca fuscata rhadinovirus]AEW87673.1 JM149 [Macaca fuscata rhadinovirus]AEW87843.1 JM149 [Macaca fuscata rhadinovirus]
MVPFGAHGAVFAARGRRRVTETCTHGANSGPWSAKCRSGSPEGHRNISPWAYLVPISGPWEMGSVGRRRHHVPAIWGAGSGGGHRNMF